MASSAPCQSINSVHVTQILTWCFGLILIRTIVSIDRLKEAEVDIEQLINSAVDELSDEEFSQAKQVLANALVDNFASNQQTALTLLFKDRFDLPDDYFDTRPQQLAQISKADVQAVVKKYLQTQHMVVVRVGRFS